MDSSSSPVAPRPATSRAPAPKRYTGLSAFTSTLLVAVLVATLFTAWTPGTLFSGDLSGQLSLLLTPEPQNVSVVDGTPGAMIRLGIVAGHWGNDSGSVCANGATEQEINYKIAALVADKLKAKGFQIDLLEEFDARLNGYQAAALISIHNDSCDYVNDQATGFKVAAAMSTRDINRANRLTACLIDRYQRTTALPFHPGSITRDMTEYHAFREIDNNTISAIIETGFLNLDYKILTEQTDTVADGVVNGILCFINNENIAPSTNP
jgi:N-acetylmuramoyl-L-alanine amidase